jgi:hypothetical protein
MLSGKNLFGFSKNPNWKENKGVVFILDIP